MIFLKKPLNLLVFLSAVFAILLQYQGNTALFFYFKPLTTLFVLLIPIIYGDKRFKNYLIYTVFALLFCWMGDIFLLDSRQFIWGLASFLVAHILFTLSFVSLEKFKFYLLPFVLLLVYGVAYYAYLYPNLGELAVPVLVYMIFIIVMSWQGLSLYIRRKEMSYQLIALAVLLFLLSDSVIALDKFKISFELSQVMVLSTYWTSIALLANAATIMRQENSSRSTI